MLSREHAREDLTSRECSKIIGGLIGVLVQMASHEDVRTAVKWWAETDKAWELLKQAEPEIDRLSGDIARKMG